MKDDSDKFLRDIRKTLNEQNDHLDGATLSRLNQARQRARTLAARRKRRITFWGWSVVPAAFAVIMVLLIRQPAEILPPAEAGIDDLQILSSEDALEFFQEDMAFYEWVYEITEIQTSPDNRGDTGAHADSSVALANSRGNSNAATTGGEFAGQQSFGISRFI